MSLTSCARTTRIDPEDVKEIRDYVKKAGGDEQAGIEAYLADLKGDWESARDELVAQGFDVGIPAPKQAEPRMQYSASPKGWDVVEPAGIEFTAEQQVEIDTIVKSVSGLQTVAYEDRIPIPEGEDLPGWGRKSQGGSAGGYYTPSLDAITIARDTGSPRVAYHEAFHRLQNLFLTADEKALLVEERPKLNKIVGSVRPIETVKRMSQKEIEAEAFAVWATGESKIKPYSTIRNAWEKVKTLIERVANALRGYGFAVAEDVFAAAKSGALKDRAGPVKDGASAMLNPAFRTWFKDSKIVDLKGNPLVVFHGSSRDITEFEAGRGYMKGLGLYFSQDPKKANIFTDLNSATDGTGKTIYPVFLSVKNPLVIKGPSFAEKVKAKLTGSRLDDRGNQSSYFDAYRLAALKAQGYDGIVNEGVNEIVVFEPTQIKSVYNTGSFDPADNRIQYSDAAVAIPSPTHTGIMGFLRSKMTDATPTWLKTVPLNYFMELAADNMTSVKTYMQVKRRLDAYRDARHAKADAIAQDWLKYAATGFRGANKARAAELSALMHDSTIAGIDPSQNLDDIFKLLDDDIAAHPDGNTATKAEAKALVERWNALPTKGKVMYETVRNAYLEQIKEQDQIILRNVEKAQLIAMQKAEDRFQEDQKRINSSGMDREAKKEAMAEALRKFEETRARSMWSMKARLTKLRQMFESSRVKPPYFPLGRFGDYTVTVRDETGSVVSFSKRETALEQQRLAEDMRSNYPGYKVEIGRMESRTSARDAMDPRMVAEIEEVLGKMAVDQETKNDVLDQLWQRYLQSMPDLSTRKRFIHRKGTAGYNEDALRTFSSHMFHAAHQMAKLKYGMELGELVNQVVKQAKEAPDPTKAMMLANEMKDRHEWVMNPTGAPWAQYLTSAAFVWFLAATPAAAVVNTTQTFIMGPAILGARRGGMLKAQGEILKASKDYASGYGSVQNANLSREEQKAMEAFYESGLIDRTQSHDIAGVGETGVEYSPVRAKVMRKISYMFHKAEVYNREVTALAAFRMARADGLKWSDAVDEAHELTYKTHFDYSNSSRPKLLQSDYMKVLLVFRAFQINMLYRLSRDLHEAFAGDTPAARREARMQFAGILGQMALWSGVTGVAGFNIMMALAGLAFGDDDDPMDFKTNFKADVIKALGPELGGIVLDGVPGHYLKIDLSARIGMPDLWFRSNDRDTNASQSALEMISGSVGALAGMFKNFYVGGSLVADGELTRGLETMAPKPVKDLMKAYRYANEGVLDGGGNTVVPVENIDGWDLIGQALGFTPAKVAEAWDRNVALKNASGRIQDKRHEIINRFTLAQKLGDEKGMQDALRDVEAFNAVPLHQAVAIKADTLRRSAKTSASNDAKRMDGALISNPLLGMQLQERLPDRVY